jgi:hypothetical protein
MPEPWFRHEARGLRATGVAVSAHAPGAQHGAAVGRFVTVSEALLVLGRRP